MNTLTKRYLLTALAFLAFLPLLIAQDSSNRNIRFGMPTAAKAEPSQREDYLIARPQYVLSYNAKTRTPNWVCWSLRKEDIGKSKRGAFEPDPLLPKGFGRNSTHVFDGSGFDRGHITPARNKIKPVQQGRRIAP